MFVNALKMTAAALKEKFFLFCYSTLLSWTRWNELIWLKFRLLGTVPGSCLACLTNR